MTVAIILILLQILTNIILDKTGISKKYFTSSGAFMLIVFVIVWEIAAVFISMYEPDWFGEMLPFLGFFISVAWRWIYGPFIVLAVQLIYSFLLKRIMVRKE